VKLRIFGKELTGENWYIVSGKNNERMGLKDINKFGDHGVQCDRADSTEEGRPCNFTGHVGGEGGSVKRKGGDNLERKKGKGVGDTGEIYSWGRPMTAKKNTFYYPS